MNPFTSDELQRFADADEARAIAAEYAAVRQMVEEYTDDTGAVDVEALALEVIIAREKADELRKLLPWMSRRVS